jgi:ribosomal protein S18 acetylase RimI-like enzyme
MKSRLIKVRPAEPQDADALAVVHETSWRNSYQGILPHSYLQRVINRRGGRYWQSSIRRKRGLHIIEYESQAVGYVSFGPCSRQAVRHLGSSRFGEIYEIYLHPVFQGLGFGGMLFDRAQSHFKARNDLGFVVRALAENDAAVQFYKKQGGVVLYTDQEVFSGRVLSTVTFYWPLTS